MIPLKVFAILGQIYALLTAVALSYLSVTLITEIIDGNDMAIAGLVVSFIWMTMTGLLMVAIREKNLIYAKVYRMFFYVGVTATLLGGLIFFHIQAGEDLTDKRIVWSLTGIVVGIVYVESIPVVWIIHGVIKFIENEYVA